MTGKELIVDLEELIDWIGDDFQDVDVLNAVVVLHTLCGALRSGETASLAGRANTFSAVALERLKRDQAT